MRHGDLFSVPHLLFAIRISIRVYSCSFVVPSFRICVHPWFAFHIGSSDITLRTGSNDLRWMGHGPSRRSASMCSAVP
jgi:hypothetical protein